MESVPKSDRCHCFCELYAHLVYACRQMMMWSKFKVMFYPDPSFAIGIICMLWVFQCEILSDRCCKD